MTVLRFEYVLILLLLNIPSVSTSETNNNNSIEKIQDKSIDKPDWLYLLLDPLTNNRNDTRFNTCNENDILSAWCNHKIVSELQCGINTEYNEYGCTCYNHPSLCPTECIHGTEMIQKTHHTIRCHQIPIDNTPNYDILHYSTKKLRKQSQVEVEVENDSTTSSMNNDNEKNIKVGECHNNLLVASWCDDYINPHLTCHMNIENDTYGCDCSGKMSFCPMECIQGAILLERTNHYIKCSNIPLDQPNYILK